ncbi:MAG TPA: glycoside hydrolase family 5 protein [Polyangiaceae bacterium]|nr:glycoside hydrolase family 5 protein [Polyangiaceae bacterium]
MQFKNYYWLSLCLIGFGTAACDVNSSSNDGPGGAPSSNGGAQAAGNSARAGAPSAGTGGLGGNGTAGGAQAGVGGSSSSAGSSGATGIRGISPLEAVKEMKLGWNLGNTLDAHPGGETAWGNPLTTKQMIDAVKAAGFNTIRLPVTWKDHLGPAPDYVIDATWLARVQELANYVLSNGMYAIVNTHHDEWISLMPDADHALITDKLSKLWTQIATSFRNHDDHLVLETFNEPRTTDATEWSGGTPAARAILNGYNAAAVKAIRDTGGNNALRFVMIPTHGANSATQCINELIVPNDDARIIISLHTYYPWAFSGDAKGTAEFGSAAELSSMNAELDRIANLTVKKGRAAIIGEWGSLDKGNTAVRVTHAQAYAAAIRQHGLVPIWWDNNLIGVDQGFGLLNRSTLTWYYPEIKDALVAGVASVP